MNQEQEEIKMNIPTAADAAAAIAKGEYERASKQSEEVADAINKAVGIRPRPRIVRLLHEPSVKSALEANGYKCHHGSQYNESYWSVAW